MNLAIMQPYFFPYIGYFQLLNASDRFVVYDDVKFINRGWINRNRILVQGDIKYITVPLCKASQNKNICDIHINTSDKKWKNRLYKTIKLAYSRAPLLDEGLKVLDDVLTQDIQNISSLATFSIKRIAEYIDINIEIINSSKAYKNTYLSGQERIVDICKKELADTYINPASGAELYDEDYFSENSVHLTFLQSCNTPYLQLSEDFKPNLSILDAVMMVEPEELLSLVNNYKILTSSSML